MSDESWTIPITGGCACGTIRYAISASPLFIMACHCTDCQEQTASAFSLGMPVPDQAFALEGEANAIAKTADSGKRSRAFRCPHCAVWTHTITDSAPDLVVVRPTTLDDPDWVRPIAQIFVNSALPWAKLDVPHSYPREFDDPETLVAAFRSSGIRPG